MHACRSRGAAASSTASSNMRAHNTIPLLLVPALLLLLPSTSALPPPSLQQRFNTWKSLYSVTYGSSTEELHRFSIWSSNFHRVAEHNARADAGLSSYRLRMNAFAHLSPSEFRRTRLGLAPSHKSRFPPYSTRSVDASSLPLPPPNFSGIDWREKGRFRCDFLCRFCFCP